MVCIRLAPADFICPCSETLSLCYLSEVKHSVHVIEHDRVVGGLCSCRASTVRHQHCFVMRPKGSTINFLHNQRTCSSKFIVHFCEEYVRPCINEGTSEDEEVLRFGAVVRTCRMAPAHLVDSRFTRAHLLKATQCVVGMMCNGMITNGSWRLFRMRAVIQNTKFVSSLETKTDNLLDFASCPALGTPMVVAHHGAQEVH
mmetsp:Transcript_34201/g.78910  ORF Transcript_34201/g.78910 Transcript_34201/m.78910 type:complete len:200 (-) Transcript_34201:1190-1789(-)